MSGFNDTDALSSLSLLPNSTATDGRCDQGCNKLGVFLALTAVVLFLIFTLYVPYIVITIRSEVMIDFLTSMVKYSCQVLHECHKHKCNAVPYMSAILPYALDSVFIIGQCACA